MAVRRLTAHHSSISLEKSPLRVAFVTSGLGVGGAETSLTTLAGGLHERGCETLVLSLRDDGAMAKELRRRGVPVVACALHRKPLRGWRSAVAELRAFGPDVVQGWMYLGNVLASLLVRRLTPPKPVVWGVRHTLQRMRDESRSTRASICSARMLSQRPALVVYNSEAGRRSHAAMGFSTQPSLVIPNGIDTGRFRPNEDARRTWRIRWGISDDTFVIGWVARFHPVKDAATFLRACRWITERHANVQIVMAGLGMDAANTTLAMLIAANGLRARVELLGPIADLEHLYPALDLLLLTSRTEALPNVLLEAMASGVPCVATDVGDCAEAIADMQCIAPAGDAAGIADAIDRHLSMTAQGRAARAVAARQRAQAAYSAERVVARYRDAYRDVVSANVAR